MMPKISNIQQLIGERVDSSEVVDLHHRCASGEEGTTTKNPNLKHASNSVTCRLRSVFHGSNNNSKTEQQEQQRLRPRQSSLRLSTPNSSSRGEVRRFNSIHHFNPTRRQREQQHQVQFSTVTVHYHTTILGDNPSVTSGAPLALGWACVDTAHYADLSSYEALEHPPPRQGGKKSTMEQLKISAPQREKLLLQQGYCTPELRQCEQQITVLRQEATRNKLDLESGKKLRDPIRIHSGMAITEVDVAAIRKSYSDKSRLSRPLDFRQSKIAKYLKARKQRFSF